MYQGIVAKYPGIKKEEMAFIDDSEKNVEAAKVFGFEGEVYTGLEVSKILCDL